MARRLFRVQDVDGRGPYRPGFSRLWSSDDGPICRPWWDELGISLAEAMDMVPTGMFGGCAFAELPQLDAWFTADERERLDAFGFFVVRFRPDRIVAATPSQVVFAQNYPLDGLPFFGRLIPVPSPLPSCTGSRWNAAQAVPAATIHAEGL